MGAGERRGSVDIGLSIDVLAALINYVERSSDRGSYRAMGYEEDGRFYYHANLDIGGRVAFVTVEAVGEKGALKDPKLSIRTESLGRDPERTEVFEDSDFNGRVDSVGEKIGDKIVPKPVDGKAQEVFEDLSMRTIAALKEQAR